MSDTEILESCADERTRCEVYSRVMGYHRPVSFWNPGKQREYADRKFFTEGAVSESRALD